MSGPFLRSRLLASAFCAIATLLPALRSQDNDGAATAPITPQDLDAARARFLALDVKRKATVIRLVERNLQWSEAAGIERIMAMRLEFDPLPAAPSTTPTFGAGTSEAEAPYRSAQGRRERREQAPTSSAYAKVASGFARPAFLPDLRREVDYDWETGAIVRLAPLGYDELFENALAGYPPAADHTVARVLAALDRDPIERKLGWYFAHTYCDLDARAFPGISLYDAWYSGKRVDVPDVDAVPFGWAVLGERSHVSPLGGRPRDQLYEKIKEAALRHRIHRTTCEAAAAAFICAEPNMDPMYALLVPRFHYLFATSLDDPDQVREKLAEHGRDDLLNEVDASIRIRDGAAFALREGRKGELQTMAATVRTTALQALLRVAGTEPDAPVKR